MSGPSRVQINRCILYLLRDDVHIHLAMLTDQQPIRLLTQYLPFLSAAFVWWQNFALKYFIAVILYTLVIFNMSSAHSPVVAAVYASRSSYHLLQRYRIKTCGILNLIPRFSWLSDSFGGAKEGVIGAIKTKGFFFPHSLIKLFRNRKIRACKTNNVKHDENWSSKKRFICYNTWQLTTSGYKKQETSNKCTAAIKIKTSYVN